MPIRKPKTCNIGEFTLTVDAGADWRRVQPILSRIRTVPIAANQPIFTVNLGTSSHPVWQSLASYILDLPGTYVVLKDRRDPGLHTRANLVVQR